MRNPDACPRDGVPLVTVPSWSADPFVSSYRGVNEAPGNRGVEMRIAVKGLIAGLALAMPTMLLAAPVSQAATPKTKACSASVSTANPNRYSTVTVTVTHVPASVIVTTSAKYKTSTNTKRTTATKKGQVAVPYKISGATKNFRVYVNVTAQQGNQKYACQTSFVPR